MDRAAGWPLVSTAVILLVTRRARKIAKSEASSYLSVRPHGTTRLPLDGLLNLIFEDFSKNLSRRLKGPLKSGKNKGYFT